MMWCVDPEEQERTLGGCPLVWVLLDGGLRESACGSGASAGEVRGRKN